MIGYFPLRFTLSQLQELERIDRMRDTIHSWIEELNSNTHV